jgi:hypothetical protein
MEIATLVFICFLVCLVIMTVSIPLLVISRTIRMLKKSYEKLFTITIKKA